VNEIYLNFSSRNNMVSPYDVHLNTDGEASQRDEKPNSDVERNFDSGLRPRDSRRDGPCFQRKHLLSALLVSLLRC